MHCFLRASQDSFPPNCSILSCIRKRGKERKQRKPKCPFCTKYVFFVTVLSLRIERLRMFMLCVLFSFSLSFQYRFLQISGKNCVKNKSFCSHFIRQLCRCADCEVWNSEVNGFSPPTPRPLLGVEVKLV